MLKSRWNRRMALTLLGATLVAGVMPAFASHEPVVRDDPWTYRDPHAGVVAPKRADGRLAPKEGALLGVHPEGSHSADITKKQPIEITEDLSGRRMDINNDYYQFFDIAEDWKPEKVTKPFDRMDPTTWDGRGLSRLAYLDVAMGRIPLVGWACQNSANINSGQYDEVIRTTGIAFKALGADFFMRYCWEMDGSKRILDADDSDSDGNKTELGVGEPEDFIRAWNRIYDIIAAPDVPMTHEVPLKVERVGAKNVVWVWCGNAAHFKSTNDGTKLAQSYYAWDYYPGDATVDWVSADGYNWALSKRNKQAGYDRDRWRGFTEIYDEFMVWARWTKDKDVTVPASMRFDEDNDTGQPDPTKPTGVPEEFPRKNAVKPIMIGEYGAIEQSSSEEDDGRAAHYTDIAPHLTKPQWIIDSHDTVNGDRSPNDDRSDGVTTMKCHWCGIFSDIAAMVYFDINADAADQNGDWRIQSTPESVEAYKISAAQDPWFKQIGNIGWPQAANTNYASTPPRTSPPVDPPDDPIDTTPTTGNTTQTTTQSGTVTKSGYWMLGSDGTVYPFGEAKGHGDGMAALAGAPAGTVAADVEPTASGLGYWLVTSTGVVLNRGDAAHYGNVDAAKLAKDEKVTSLSATTTGKGYWVFTTRGRVLNFGDAVAYGDTVGLKLNGAVLDSIPTTTGKGYYMVAADGGIFSFGDAAFHGSMGDKKLNAPVQSLVPDPDGEGYWLVASDGGIFAFKAPFRGSMGDKKLNKPVTGMVAFGDGYLMVAEDGGIFNFSNKQFHGSLGDRPPAKPIVAVAPLEG